MNKRIKLLAEQAGCGWWKGSAPRDMTRCRNDLEKFAELIMQECITVSEAHAQYLQSQPTDPTLEEYESGIVNGIFESTAAIKEHFGFKE